MTTIKRALVCIDFSDVTPAVVDHGVALAAGAGAEVRLLHVAAPDPDFVGYAAGPESLRQNVALELRTAHRALEALAKPFANAKIAVTPLMVQGATIETIVEQADRFGADVIVMGSHGHGALFHLLAGSVTEGVIRKSAAAVLVVPSRRRLG